jgi:hypothetical protein
VVRCAAGRGATYGDQLAASGQKSCTDADDAAAAVDAAMARSCRAAPAGRAPTSAVAVQAGPRAAVPAPRGAVRATYAGGKAGSRAPAPSPTARPTPQAPAAAQTPRSAPRPRQAGGPTPRRTASDARALPAAPWVCECARAETDLVGRVWRGVDLLQHNHVHVRARGQVAHHHRQEPDQHAAHPQHQHFTFSLTAAHTMDEATQRELEQVRGEALRARESVCLSLSLSVCLSGCTCLRLYVRCVYTMVGVALPSLWRRSSKRRVSSRPCTTLLTSAGKSASVRARPVPHTDRQTHTLTAKGRSATGKPGNKLERSDEACLTNCVERFVDVGNLLVQRLQENRGR